MDDGLSDFDTNFSGRDTPILSGRDSSPSSHSRNGEEDSGSHVGQQRARVNSNVNSSSNNNVGSLASSVAAANGASTIGRQSVSDPTAQNLANGVMMRGPQLLPVTVKKDNGEDINDKFCKFEINKGELNFM